MTDKREITPERVQTEYTQAVAYNEGIGLYDKVKTCERFYEGDQWEGVQTKQVRPLTINFIRQLAHYKVAQIVSDDVGQDIEPFLPDEAARQAATVLEQSIDRVVERQQIRDRHRELLRDAYIDGDAALYFWWDNAARTGMEGVQGDIAAETVMNTNILFGNPAERNVQRQPYLIIVQRLPVQQVRKMAKEAGCPEWENIQADSGGRYLGDEDTARADQVTTLLTRFWKGEDGTVRFCKTCGTVMVQQETATAMTLYPVAYMSWTPRKMCYHGVQEVAELVNAQIAINKMYTALTYQSINNAFPKMVYSKQQFPNGWDESATRIGVMGDPTKALTGVAGSMPLPSEPMSITDGLLTTVKNIAGTNDAALGNIKNPDNTSAIVAVQQATAAPLSLTRLAYYQFVEDYERVLIDMMHAYYGLRAVKVTQTVTDPLSGETSEEITVQMYDFSALPVDALDLDINIGAASYWAETLQITTLDNMMGAGLIPSALEYLARVPDGMVRDKAGLEDAIRRQQQAAQMAPMTPTDIDGGILT